MKDNNIDKEQLLSQLKAKYETDTFKVLYLYTHSRFGFCVVCSEIINGEWGDGYYIQNNNRLIRVSRAR